MKLNICHTILIILIILAVSLPAVICYLLFVRNSSSSIQSDHTGQNTEFTSETPDGSDDAGHKCIILIDPGHGGYDPGKVSPDGIKEKDINLAVSHKLVQTLKDRGYSVFLTRDSDLSLGSSDTSSRKMSDLKARTDMAAAVNADLYISVHQNSYSAEYVHGAQVFYYTTSSDGKCLAECIQKHLISDADSGNSREAKGNSEYLVLTESPCTAVIVECGFLSNTNECARLCSEDYQAALANAISNGIDSWLAAGEGSTASR